MVKVFNGNIQVISEDGENFTNIITEQDYLELYNSAREFAAEQAENYPWMTDRDVEEIEMALLLHF